MKLEEIKKALSEAKAKAQELEALLHASERIERINSLAQVGPDYLGKALGIAKGVRRFVGGGGIAVGFIPRPEFLTFAVDHGVDAFRVQQTAILIANNTASFDWALERVDW